MSENTENIDNTISLDSIGVSFEEVGAAVREAMEAVALISTHAPSISTLAIAYLKGRRASLDHVADVKDYDAVTAAMAMLADC